MGKQSVSTGVVVAVLVIVVVAIAAVGWTVFGSRGAAPSGQASQRAEDMRQKAQELAKQAQQGRLKGPPPAGSMPSAQ